MVSTHIYATLSNDSSKKAMADLDIDIQQLNTVTLVLLGIFVLALAAVCSIARNTIDCLACPMRWFYSGVTCMKDIFCFLCCADEDEYL